jgi:hypothetical protein
MVALAKFRKGGVMAVHVLYVVGTYSLGVKCIPLLVRRCRPLSAQYDLCILPLKKGWESINNLFGKY